MLRIVFDSNVFISALLFSGLPRKILNLSINNQIKLITSKEIISETAGVLRNKFQWPEHNISKFIRRVSSIGEIVNPTIRLKIIKEKESDNRILECAVAGNAHLIISGDKHLLRLKNYKNIPIKNPKFLTYLVKEVQD